MCIRTRTSRCLETEVLRRIHQIEEGLRVMQSTLKKSMMLNLVGVGGIGGPARSQFPLELGELHHSVL